MGNLLFNRAAVVTVETDVGSGIEFGSVPESTAEHSFYRQGLRVVFDVVKSSEANANTARIQVYNASSESRAKVEREGQRILLRAGYSVYPGMAPTIENLFSGTVASVNTVRNGPDIITTFEAGDAEKDIQQAKINKSYAPRSLALQIINDLASSIGVRLDAESLASIPTTIFQHGFTATGSSKKILSELVARMGLEWSIQDGELKVLKPGLPSSDLSIVLTSDTGLLSVSNIVKEGGKPDAKKTGIEARSLLYPSIRPHRLLTISSQKINGAYKVRKVTHRGDTHEGEWTSTTEAHELG